MTLPAIFMGCEKWVMEYSQISWDSSGYLRQLFFFGGGACRTTLCRGFQNNTEPLIFLPKTPAQQAADTWNSFNRGKCFKVSTTDWGPGTEIPLANMLTEMEWLGATHLGGQVWMAEPRHWLLRQSEEWWELGITGRLEAEAKTLRANVLFPIWLKWLWQG